MTLFFVKLAFTIYKSEAKKNIEIYRFLKSWLNARNNEFIYFTNFFASQFVTGVLLRSWPEKSLSKKYSWNEFNFTDFFGGFDISHNFLVWICIWFHGFISFQIFIICVICIFFRSVFGFRITRQVYKNMGRNHWTMLDDTSWTWQLDQRLVMASWWQISIISIRRQKFKNLGRGSQKM